MTDMQKLYLKTRTEQKTGHRATLRAMAKVTGIDPDSIDRVLQRARQADAIDAKRARKAAKKVDKSERLDPQDSAAALAPVAS